MKLKEYLKQKKVKHHEFARLIGVHRQQVTRLVSGIGVSLSIALRIETVTRGEVSAREAMFPQIDYSEETDNQRFLAWDFAMNQVSARGKQGARSVAA